MKKIDKSEINIPAAVSLKKIIESMPTKIKSSRKALKKFSITFIYSPTRPKFLIMFDLSLFK